MVQTLYINVAKCLATLNAIAANEKSIATKCLFCRSGNLSIKKMLARKIIFIKVYFLNFYYHVSF